MNPRGTYRAVADDLRRRIEEGEFTRQLPSRIEIAAHYKVSASLAERAVNTLQDEGVIECVHGVGTFVAGTRDNRPIVEQLVDLLRTGLLPVGSKFPTEQSLCDELGIARNTLRPNLARLEERGLIGRAGGPAEGRIVLALPEPPDKEAE